MKTRSPVISQFANVAVIGSSKNRKHLSHLMSGCENIETNNITMYGVTKHPYGVCFDKETIVTYKFAASISIILDDINVNIIDIPIACITEKLINQMDMIVMHTSDDFIVRHNNVLKAQISLENCVLAFSVMSGSAQTLQCVEYGAKFGTIDPYATLRRLEFDVFLDALHSKLKPVNIFERTITNTVSCCANVDKKYGVLFDTDEEIPHVPVHNVTDEDRVKAHPMYFRNVANKTYLLKMLAVCGDGNMLEHIEDQTEQLCRFAVDQNPNAFKYVRQQTDRLCTEVLLKDGMQLEHVHHKTDHLCQIGVRQNGRAIQFALGFATDHIIEIALKSDGTALEFVIPLIKDRTPLSKIRFYEIAVRSNGLAIKYIPLADKSEMLCLLAVTQNGLALENIEMELQTPTICHTAVCNNYSSVVFAINGFMLSKYEK